MIQANELRIGNWYNCANPMEGGKLYHNQFTIWTEYLEFEAYGEPIPLTTEILDKVGFNKADDWNDTWLWLNGFGVNYHLNNWHWNDLQNSVKLTSLHQLQSLYYLLTNQELNFEL